MKKNKKLLALVCCMALLVGTVGATLAWLMDQTEDITNTFTTSDINLELRENTGEEYQMIPGHTIDKDPIVTVKSGSEDAWVFLEVTETANLDKYISYQIDTNNWTTLKEGNVAVYYCKYGKRTDTDIKIKVLSEGTYNEDNMTISWGPNQVLVKPTVTKDMMEDLNEGNATKPNLKFKAYAVQRYKSNGVEFTPAEAWAQAQTLNP